MLRPLSLLRLATAPLRRVSVRVPVSFSFSSVATESATEEPLPTPKVVTHTGEKFLKMKEDYMQLKVPDGMDRDQIYRKRLMYRSQQRGWLEVDLMLGNFAKKYVPGFTAEECTEYEEILEMETVDILNLLLQRDEPPTELVDSPVLKKLIDYCQGGAVIGMDLLNKGNQ